VLQGGPVSPAGPSPYWGRWGEQDQRGALNRITPECVKRGIAAVQTGQALPLGLPLVPGGGPLALGRMPLQHFMIRDGGDYAAGLPERGFGFADDAVVMSASGTTHLDALAHVWLDRQMWNGYSADLVTSRGAGRCGIETAGPIATRALFVDLGPPSGPCLSDPHQVSLADLRGAVDRTALEPEPGDALILRTGWLRRWRDGDATEAEWSGLTVECAEWIDEQGFALVGADNIGVEFGPTGDRADAAPLHVELMRNRGVFLLELMDLEALAETGRHEFLLMVAPLHLVGGAASPVNPVALL
jgi:hypothetical protein